MLNQLSKQNDSAPHNKTFNTKTLQTELIADSKLTESSKKFKKSNTERVKNVNKNIAHIDPKQSTSLHKSSGNACTKENVDDIEDNSSINNREINSKSEKLIVILGDSILKHLNGWEMSKNLRATARFLSSIFHAQQQITWRITWVCQKTQIL